MPKLTNREQANLIRKKERRNDVFFTPKSLVKIHLDILTPLVKPYDTILEPSCGDGAYLDEIVKRFPEANIEWCEILRGKDFFLYSGNPDIIITNPPFSLLKQFIERTIELRPRIISFLLNAYGVTPCRIREFNDKGYFVVGYHMTRVNKWFGVSVILTLSREVTENLAGFGFDCQKHILEGLLPQSEPTQSEIQL